MRKGLSLLLIVMLLTTVIGMASAESFYSYMNYYNHLDNAASIDWLEDAHAKGPAEVVKFYGNSAKTYKPNPALDAYPEKTAMVYRTAGFYGGQVAVRNNTSIVVFAEKTFQTTGEGYDYLASLGLIELIDGLKGSVILVTPADCAAGFGEADLANYTALHDAMYRQRVSERTEAGVAYYADSEYFGAYGKIYFVGIEGGASFINNYVAATPCIGQACGLFLVGGTMNEDATIAAYVPTYLLNGTDTAIAAYRAINGTDTYSVDAGRETFTNAAAPLRRVMAKTDAAPALDAYVKEAFYDLLLDAQRLSVAPSYLREPASNLPYTDVVEPLPISRFALAKRNAIINGVTKDGALQVSFHKEEIFSEYKTMYDQYLQTWYEVLPTAVVENTAPAGSVPLILGLHGTGDDPLMYADEIGLLEVAGEQGVALVVPFEEELVISHEGAVVAMGVPIYEGVNIKVLPMLVDYMLEKYPALDASRVYATGYSLGGGSTYRAVYGGMEQIAAAVPMAGMHPDMIYASTPEEDARLDAIDMPCLILTSTYDLGYVANEAHLTDTTLFTIDIFCKANNIAMPEVYDFEKYPMVGLPSDRMEAYTVGGEWRSFMWYRNNDQGIPMVAISCTENLSHALYAGYAEIAWDFMKHYSRDLETGAVQYDPFVA